MTQHDVDNCGRLQPAAWMVPLRGPTGRLWAMYDPQTQTIEFRHGQTVERFDLRQHQQTQAPNREGNGE